MKSITLLCGVLLFTYFSSQISAADPFGYTVETNVVYGSGKITKEGKVLERDLLMDVYTPTANTSIKKKPAVILVHGGAFHRGGLRKPPFKEDGAVHSGMQDYAQLLAPLGYVCFVIEYRLTQEQPVLDLPFEGEELQPYQKFVTQESLRRTNFARRAMGLSEVPANNSLVIWKGILAPSEDLNKAVLNIIASAEKYGIDPESIGMGGHSAGATTVLNSAYGIKSPVKAVFPLSPAVVGYDFNKVIDSPELPAMLLVMSQNDLPLMRHTIPLLMDKAQTSGIDFNFAWVPAFGHFYPTGAVSLGNKGVRTSVGERVITFLDRHLKN